MKFRHDKENDGMMIWFSDKPVDDAEQTKDVIVHFSKDKDVVPM